MQPLASLDRIVIIVSLALLGIEHPPAANGAEIVCGNVNDDARTYYSSNTTASKTTVDKKCTVSVGAATANSLTPGPIEYVSRCVALVPHERFDAQQFASQIVPVLAGASVPNFKLTKPVKSGGPLLTADDCLSSLQDALSSAAFDSDLHRALSQSTIDSISACLKGGSSGGEVRCLRNKQAGTLAIEFSTKFGQHVVAIPLRR